MYLTLSIFQIEKEFDGKGRVIIIHCQLGNSHRHSLFLSDGYMDSQKKKCYFYPEVQSIFLKKYCNYY